MFGSAGMAVSVPVRGPALAQPARTATIRRQLGTRFVAVKESIANPNYQQAIIAAKDTDTAVTCRRLLPARSLKTAFSRQLLEMERAGATAEEIRDFLGYSRARTAQIEGDLERGEAYCGASAGLIKDIVSAETVVRGLVEGCAGVQERICMARNRGEVEAGRK